MLHKKPQQILNTFFLFIMVFISSAVYAAEKSPVLEKKIQNIKQEVLDLNKELFILEEDLLFPANTQFSIFLSMDIGNLFDLDSVRIDIDGKNISNHLYTLREINALKRGGVQRILLLFSLVKAPANVISNVVQQLNLKKPVNPYL